MLTTLLLTYALQGQETVPSGPLVSKVFARYYNAPTLIAEIKCRVVAGNEAQEFRTEVNIERPSKLCIRQARLTPNPKSWLITANGKVATYDAPENGVSAVKRLSEPMCDEPGARISKVNQVYGVAGAQLGDKSTPLDIIIGHIEDLRVIQTQWARMDKQAQPIEFNGIKAYRVGGAWQEARDVPTPARFSFIVDAEGKMYQYNWEAEYTDVGEKGRVVKVRIQWDITSDFEKKPNPKVFDPN
ncbi:MAG: hypothetical protein JST35_04240 [Armatimonadetes bacterium]|nr:hypothetical protein [Armatimonadota bacterium]